MSTEDEVRKASARFYSALNRMLDGDTAPLADIWSHGAAVTTMHPIGGRQTGWDEVRGSFGQVAELASGGHAELRDQSIQVDGDVAWEVGVEQGQATLAGERVTIEQRVTNIYRREARGGRSSITTPMSHRRCWAFSAACRPHSRLTGGPGAYSDGARPSGLTLNGRAVAAS